VGKAAGAWR